MNTTISFATYRSLQPQVINGTPVDGVVNGRPVQVRRIAQGFPLPVNGTEVQTSYGPAIVRGVCNNFLRLEVTKFKTEIGRQAVSRLADCFNIEMKNWISDLIRVTGTENGNLPKEVEERLENFRPFASNEFRATFSGLSLKSNDQVVVKVLDLSETPLQKRKRRAIEIAEAKRLADALLRERDMMECPEDIRAELDEEFGMEDF